MTKCALFSALLLCLLFSPPAHGRKRKGMKTMKTMLPFGKMSGMKTKSPFVSKSGSNDGASSPSSCQNPPCQSTEKPTGFPSFVPTSEPKQASPTCSTTYQDYGITCCDEGETLFRLQHDPKNTTCSLLGGEEAFAVFESVISASVERIDDFLQDAHAMEQLQTLFQLVREALPTDALVPTDRELLEVLMPPVKTRVIAASSCQPSASSTRRA